MRVLIGRECKSGSVRISPFLVHVAANAKEPNLSGFFPLHSFLP
jgi:hypothetical protein